jgi:hypothetical protein
VAVLLALLLPLGTEFQPLMFELHLVGNWKPLKIVEMPSDTIKSAFWNITSMLGPVLHQ